MNTSLPRKAGDLFGLVSVFVLSGIVALAGCGTASVPGDSQVSVFLRADAPGQPMSFTVTVTDISLVNEQGAISHLLAAPQTLEGIHADGLLVPLASIDLKQDTYQSASITYEATAISFVQGGSLPTTQIYEDLYVNGSTASSPVTISAPLVVSSSSSNIILSLDVGSSYVSNQDGSVSVTPKFSATQANMITGSGSGLYFADLVATVESVSDNTMTLNTIDGATITVGLSQQTEYDGDTSAALIQVGSIVDLDCQLNADGRIAATRVESDSQSSPDIVAGPLVPLSSGATGIAIYPRQQYGQDFPSVIPVSVGIDAEITSSTLWLIEGSLPPTGTLPFSPQFGPANYSFAQNIAILGSFSNSTGIIGSPGKIILLPQVVTGTVTNITNINSATQLTISLEANDYFGNLTGQTQVAVYVLPSTNLSSGSLPQIGSQVRCYGFVFDDNGVYRVVCKSLQASS